MQHTSHIGLGQAISNAFHKAYNRIKTFLTNETVQKVTLFVAIITLLIIAANLEAIM